MSNEQISEIFALGRESFFGGQKSFQVQAYPFRMTAANMAKHRNNPNMPFWRMLKEGNDHFEVTRLEPKVDVCERRYVFNAAAPGNYSPLSFSPRGKCPVYEVPQEVAEAVQSKQRDDELQFAQLAARNTPTAPIKSGRDGGMHPTFIAKLRPQEVIDERGNAKLIVDPNNPGPMVAFSASSPSDAEVTNSAAVSAPIQMADVPLPRNAPQAKVGARPASEPTFAEKIGNFFRGGSREPEAASTRVASVQPMAPTATASTNTAPQRETIRSRVSRAIGLRGSSEKQTEVPTRATPAAATSRTPSETPKVKTAAAPASNESPAPRQAPVAAPASSQSTGSVMSGSQPIPQTSSFESRFGAFR